MSRPPSAATLVAGVIGDPVRHSRSPAILNAAFAAVGLDWTYVAFEVQAGSGAAAAEAMRVLGLVGLSVTMPHKEEVIAALDELAPAAERLGAVNCIERRGARLIGHNTDGAGFVSALRSEGFSPEGSRCVVLGAGGAARAVVLALHEAGAREVAVVNRTAARAQQAAALAGDRGRASSPADLATELAEADLLVNATPIGMGPADPSPVEPAIIHGDLFVSDLVYHPDPSPLTLAAAAAGARCSGGLGMLVGQAAEAFRIWTGLEPPLEEMAAAAAAGPDPGAR